ncbi:MAG TPA: VanZ family protein [Candidatus Sulfotelmatobacter sp.]|nr:VanZ family protein [Candidatus Sulfotelmatobacter sp.]
MPLGTRVRSWLPVVAWACVISLLSTDAFSTAHTSRFLIPVLHWIFPRASAETLDLMHAVIRKAAHLTEYFILGILLNRALRGDPGWNPKWAIWAIVIAACYASLDEFHQSFVPSRTASPWDALLDTVGASAAQVVFWVWHSLRARNGETKTTSRANSDTRYVK